MSAFFALRAATSASVSSSRPAYSAGRSDGMFADRFQMPCRSGSPQPPAFHIFAPMPTDILCGGQRQHPQNWTSIFRTLPGATGYNRVESLTSTRVVVYMEGGISMRVHAHRER